MKPEKVYACFNKDKDVRLSSSSPRDGAVRFPSVDVFSTCIQPSASL